MRYLFGLWGLWLFPMLLTAQSEISFLASTDADRVVPGQVFTVSYQLSNIDVDQFLPPGFSNFEIISGPNRSSQISIVNGQRSMSFTYSYQLIAERAGQFTLPPAKAKTEKGILVSNQLEIEVVPASAQPSGKEDTDFFIRLETSADTAYVGQQVLLDYVLYTRVNIENVYTLKDAELEGLYHTTINRFPSAVTQSSVNGQAYTRQVLKRLAVYPQKSGSYTLGPVILRLDISEGTSNSPFSFFRNVVKKEATAPVKVLEVQAIPTPVALGFSGGVGDFSLQARIQDQETEVGSAVELEVRVEGNGDPNVLDAPQLWISGAAESLEPNLRFEDEQVYQGQRTFVKTFSYLLVPEEAGKFEVTPTLITLDPGKGYDDTLKADVVEFYANPKGQSPQDQSMQYLPDQEDESSQGIYIVLGVLFVLSLGGFFWWKHRSKAGSIVRSSSKPIELQKEIQNQIQSGQPQLGKIRSLLEQWQDVAPEPVQASINTWLKELDFQQFNPQQNTSDQLEWLRKLEMEV